MSNWIPLSLLVQSLIPSVSFLSPLYVWVSHMLWRPHTSLAYFSESLRKISATRLRSQLPWPVDMRNTCCYVITWNVFIILVTVAILPSVSTDLWISYVLVKWWSLYQEAELNRPPINRKFFSFPLSDDRQIGVIIFYWLAVTRFFKRLARQSGLPDDIHILKPKIPIQVNFRWPLNRKCWYILRPNGIFYGHLVI
jgi:hypothetical protein